MKYKKNTKKILNSCCFRPTAFVIMSHIGVYYFIEDHVIVKWLHKTSMKGVVIIYDRVVFWW